MSHWCRDIPRDEAVRAAEDGRSGPLPTLEEAIAVVTDRRPVQPGGGGNVTGGLRTERVTLEVTHDLDAPLGDWIVQVLDESLGFDESVRVVDNTAERITQALTADRFASAVAEADRLRARVAELESSAPAASGAAGTEVVAWGVIEYHGGPIIHATPDEDEATQYAGYTAPLYAAPQPAKGWLTEKERETLMRISYGLDYAQFATSADFIRSFLARSSPPQVVPPEQEFRSHSNALRDAEWFAALASAGVAVKEVGRE